MSSRCYLFWVPPRLNLVMEEGREKKEEEEEEDGKNIMDLDAR